MESETSTADSNDNFLTYLTYFTSDIKLAVGLTITVILLPIALTLSWKDKCKTCTHCGLPWMFTLCTSLYLLAYVQRKGSSWIEIVLLIYAAELYFTILGTFNPLTKYRSIQNIILPCAYIFHLINNEHTLFNVIWSYNQYLEYGLYFYYFTLKRKRNFNSIMYYSLFVTSIIKLMCLLFLPSMEKLMKNYMNDSLISFTLLFIYHLYVKNKSDWHKTFEEDEADKNKTEKSKSNDDAVKEDEIVNQLENEKTESSSSSISESEWDIVDTDKINNENETTAESCLLKNNDLDRIKSDEAEESSPISIIDKKNL